MLWLVPITQVTLVLGALPGMDGAARVKTTSLVSPLAGLPAGLTRTSAWAVATAGISTLTVPVVAVAAPMPDASGAQVAPASPLKSTSKLAAAPRLWFQVTDRVV